LFAPFLPYVTEEVWSWWQQGSVHRAAWPVVGDLGAAAAHGDRAIYQLGADILTAVRKEKALQKVSLRAPVALVTVNDVAERLELLAHVERDLAEAGNVARMERAVADTPSVVTVLAPVGG
ncbi:MAG: class I tRNA ligase family protein, partial [Actinomycetota bacterium]